MISVGGVITGLTLLGLLADLPEKVDPLVHTEEEAESEHEHILAQADTQEHAQAAFNAYALRSILLQEIEILELQIEAEEDRDERQKLKDELKSKLEFIRSLEAEQRRQLTKGEDEDE